MFYHFILQKKKPQLYDHKNNYRNTTLIIKIQL